MNFRSNLNSVRVKMPGDTAVEAPVGDNDKKIDEPVTKRDEETRESVIQSNAHSGTAAR